jgi:hypothetical protein
MPELEVFTAKSGVPSARAKLPDGRFLLLHSAYDPVREAQNLTASFSLEEARVVILLGLGLGYHLEEIAKKIPPEAKILVIEKYGELINRAKTKLKNLPWPRITITGEEEKIKHFVFFHREEITGRQPVIIEHPPSFRLDQAYYSMMRTRVRDYISQLAVELNTARTLNPSIQRNLLKNFSFVLQDPGLGVLKDAFLKKPAVIVAAGPSLAKNIDLLPRAKNRGVLICVGTALKALQKRGIEPDLVVTIDPLAANYRLFENMSPTRAFLCYEHQTCPDILPLFPERRFAFHAYVNHLGLWLRTLYGYKGEIEPGGSAAIAAFEIACLLGADPIVFIGQDLAYTDGYTHARGTHYEGQKAELDNPHVIAVPAVGGGTVYTSRALHAFLVRFEELFKKHSNRLIIDATEGGAVKRGAEIMTFREALERYFLEEFPVLARIEELHAKGRSPVSTLLPKAAEEMRRTVQEYEDFLKKLDNVIDLAKTVGRLDAAAAAASPAGNGNGFWRRAAGQSLKEKAVELNSALKEVNARSKMINLLSLLTIDVELARSLPDDATLAEQLERIRDAYGRYRGAAAVMIEQLKETLAELEKLENGPPA